MRNLLCVLMLVPLAGCLGGGSDPLQELEAPAAFPSTLSYTGCHDSGVVVGVPAAFFEGLLPDGFSPVPFDAAGGTVALVVMTLACDEATSAHGPLGATQTLLGLLPVLVPAAYAHADSTAHSIVLGGFVENDEVLSVLQAWGYTDTFYPGDVDVRAQVDTEYVRDGHGSGTDGSFSVRTVATLAGAPEAHGGFSGRAFGVDWANRTVNVIEDFAYTEYVNGGAGSGLLEMDVRSGVAGMLPFVEGSAGFGFSGWGYDFEFSRVDLPAADASGAQAATVAPTELWRGIPLP